MLALAGDLLPGWEALQETGIVTVGSTTANLSPSAHVSLIVYHSGLT